MSGGRTARVAARIGACGAAAAAVLLLAPQEASACAVGIGYAPNISVGDVMRHRTCSAGTSATGSLVVDLLAVAALAVAGVLVLRSAGRALSAAGAAAAAASPGGAAGFGPPPQMPGPGATDAQRQALTDYLYWAGVLPSTGGPHSASS
ncbi:hypothetical protein [Streptomyces beihaiensis]|uniref:Uncharacterized protein n=1 Tax=Streptomyces beihaiensis TaxID=2984495 RepID=A0ABT3TT71_9ACTN|nr:hypothetical protein [Streptomyces beihaiensis]MCX3059985.1 hypothetical protein [Streptomyces beihaiensis]